jgi:hypothetical protein
MSATHNLGTQSSSNPHEAHERNLVSVIGSCRPARTTETDQGELPAPGEYVVVRCHGFQCLAYRDSDGRWRDARSKGRLAEVLEIVLRF